MQLDSVKKRELDRYKTTFKKPILVVFCLLLKPQALFTALADVKAEEIAEPGGLGEVSFWMQVGLVLVGCSS